MSTTILFSWYPHLSHGSSILSPCTVSSRACRNLQFRCKLKNVDQLLEIRHRKLWRWWKDKKESEQVRKTKTWKLERWRLRQKSLNSWIYWGKWQTGLWSSTNVSHVIRLHSYCLLAHDFTKELWMGQNPRGKLTALVWGTFSWAMAFHPWEVRYTSQISNWETQLQALVCQNQLRSTLKPS